MNQYTASSIFSNQTSLWGLDKDFWLAMTAVLLIVILMNVIFWRMSAKITPTKNK